MDNSKNLYYYIMREYFTEALVLDKKDSGELDNLIFFYTEKLGKVVARAKSSRKITSKLAGHLEPLNYVKVRLVDKNGFQVVDALTSNRQSALRTPKTSAAQFGQALIFLQFIEAITMELQPDKKIWLTIKKSFKNLEEDKFSYKPILQALGFDPQFASCNVCEKQVDYFSKTEHVFLCKKCAVKIKKDEVVLME